MYTYRRVCVYHVIGWYWMAAVLTSMHTMNYGPAAAPYACTDKDSTLAWYQERLPGQDVKTVWEYLRNHLFRKVKIPIADHQNSDLAAEYAAERVRDVITYREKWLKGNNLDTNKIMNDEENQHS